MNVFFTLDEVTSYLCEAWVTDKIEKRKIEKAKARISTQLTDFLNGEFVEKYEYEQWFSKCFDMMCRDRFLKQIFSHFFELDKSISIESLCDSFTHKFIDEYPQYSVLQKQIFDAIKWLACEIIRILKTNEELPKEYAMHFDIFDLGQNSIGIQLETLREVRQIYDLISLNYSSNPPSDAIKELYAIFYENTTFLQKQREILEWISKGNSVKEAMVCLAFLERDEGNIDRAIGLFEYVAENYPEEVDLYNNAGCLSLDIGEYEKANKCFNKVAFSDNGNKCDAYYNLAMWEYEVANLNMVDPPVEGKYYYSINMVNHALDNSPDDIDSLNFKAYLLMISKQDMEEAYLLFCKCIEREDKYEYRVNLAIFYLLNRNFDKAESEVRELLQMHENTEDSLLYGLLGNIYGTYEVDRIEEAIMMFEKAYRFSSDDNYLSTADKLRNGGHIDSVFLNGAIIEIYTDHEVIELYRTLH